MWQAHGTFKRWGSVTALARGGGSADESSPAPTRGIIPIAAATLPTSQRGALGTSLISSRRMRVTAAALISATTIALISCTHPAADDSFYESHPDVRAAKIAECSKMYAPANDQECRAAVDADQRAIRAEHGPPFHGHDAAWYGAHTLPAVQEIGYCDTLRKPISDPDCAAAQKGSVHF